MTGRGVGPSLSLHPRDRGGELTPSLARKAEDFGQGTSRTTDRLHTTQGEKQSIDQSMVMITVMTAHAFLISWCYRRLHV